MAYIYPQVETLIDKPAYGNQQCAILIQHHADAPLTAKWKEGTVVRGETLLAKGTAIATFVGGKYPNKSTGNHVAFYLSQDKTGLFVVDQYMGSNGIHQRKLHFKGKTPTGTFVDPSNNGDAFSVIE